jgi:hypothetical protein
MSSHHGPLEVGDGAGYCIQTVIVGERTAVFGDVGELAPGAGADRWGYWHWGHCISELVISPALRQWHWAWTLPNGLTCSSSAAAQ